MLRKPVDSVTQTQAKYEALKAEYQQFAYVVCHDLKSPLRHIDGFTKRIKKRLKDTLDEKSREDFAVVDNSVARAEALLEALLAFSRLSTTEEPLGPVDCNALVKRTLTQLFDTDGGEQLIAGPLPVIDGYRKQLATLFYHLLHNAKHYQPAGQVPAVSVAAVEIEHYWQFTLTDNGIGIAANRIGRVFDIFTRAARETDYPGLGLGLTLAKKVVQCHAGEIRIESEEGKGTTVFFTLSKYLSADRATQRSSS
ncbi:hypothetical protein FKG94_02240 [Exilibacterium tricleocarpae]|uniref:histidine kinase n=1 Tax=Exilibacterium tricleocarpae TaxID=2591008 RepID=A0A545U885_9GAMM|nr:ATP-binding protein [Exilibacterium tricleocarpae]TQV85684.1 hypothetical protein FKG94_02240 [Exilibacterium tricleocarpae]